MTQLDDDSFGQELTDYVYEPNLFVKNKNFKLSVLMKAYFDTCFWSKTLRNKLTAQVQNNYLAN